MYKGRGWWKDSEGSAIEVLLIKKQILGNSSPVTLRAMKNLVIIPSVLERYNDAVILTLEVVNLSETA